MPSRCRASSLRGTEDDRRVAIHSYDEPLVRVWDTATGRELAKAGPLEGEFGDLALSRDGSLLLIASGTSAELWDVASGKRLRSFPAQNPVFSAAFSADDQFVLTGGADGRARVWETSSGRPVAVHVTGGIGEAWLGENGRLLALGGGTALVFDCPACQPPTELLAEARAEIQERPARSASGS